MPQQAGLQNKKKFSVPKEDDPLDSFTGISSSAIGLSASTLLTAMWPSPNRIHQVGWLDRKTGVFKNQHVNDIAAAIKLAEEYSATAKDAYFACAEYITPNSRITDNVFGSYAFFCDIDCGEDKAANGNGYLTEAEARQALSKFCNEAEIPYPNFIVSSGGGLHVYWVLVNVVEREQWQAFAFKIKSLTHAQNFLADDTRTADIASVLRVPNTLNYKYKPPRPVTLIYASDNELINNSSMFSAIDAAYAKYCPAADTKVAATNTYTNAEIMAMVYRLDPDMEYGAWIKISMAIHHVTGGSEEGMAIFNEWSSRGGKYKGVGEIQSKWRSFKTDRENSYNIGTIINMLKAQGIDWRSVCADADNLFESCNTISITGKKSTVIKSDVIHPGSKTANLSAAAENTIMVDADKSIKLINPLDKYSLRGKSGELEKNAGEEVYVLDGIALKGNFTNIVAPPNAGKTLLALTMLTAAINDGRIDPSTLYYLNMDDTGKGLFEKVRIAEEYGFHMLSEGWQGFSANQFAHNVSEIIDNNQADKAIIVLDTLKKFVNVMCKTKSSVFTKNIRKFVQMGGTLIVLSHANKRPGPDGKPVYGGTSDIVDDCDCAYTLSALSKQPVPGQKIVEFDNIKRRGNVVQSATYSYSTTRCISYSDLLASVKSVDQGQIEIFDQAEAIKAEDVVIKVVVACVIEGITVKIKLAEAVAERAGVGKKSAIKIIEKYTGNDPSVHRWNFTVGDRGAKIFSVLNPIPPEQGMVERDLDNLAI